MSEDSRKPPLVILTEAGVLAQLTTKFQHGLAKDRLGLWVAGALLLPTDLGHGVDHAQFGPGR